MEKREIDFIAMHFLRCPSVVLQLLRANIEEDDFPDGVMQPYALLWATVRNFYERFHKMPKYLEAQHLLETRISSGAFVDEYVAKSARDILRISFEIPDDGLAEDFIINGGYLETFMTHMLVDPRVRLAQNVPAEYKQAALDDINDAARRAKVLRNSKANIFSDYTSYGYEAPPEPTGVAWLDAAVSGIYEGSLCGLLAWPGGGKTAAGVQIVAEAAMQRKHSAFFCYEQGVKGDVSTRFMSYVTELPRPCFQGSASQYAPEVIAALNRVGPAVEPYLHVYDMSGAVEGQGTGGVDEIAHIIERTEQDTGDKIKFCVMDWVGVAVKRDPRCERFGDTEHAKIEGFMSQLNELTNRTGVIMLALHQLTPGLRTGKSPFFLPDQTMAHNCKSYSQLTNYMFSFGLMDEATNCMFLNVSKARNSALTHRLVRLDAQYNRIVDAQTLFVPNDMRSGSEDPFFVQRKTPARSGDVGAAPPSMADLTG